MLPSFAVDLIVYNHKTNLKTKENIVSDLLFSQVGRKNKKEIAIAARPCSTAWPDSPPPLKLDLQEIRKLVLNHIPNQLVCVCILYVVCVCLAPPMSIHTINQIGFVSPQHMKLFVHSCCVSCCCVMLFQNRSSIRIPSNPCSN